MRSTKELQNLCNLYLLSPIIIISLFPIALICLLCYFYLSLTPLSPQAQLIIFPQYYSNATNSSSLSPHSSQEKPLCDYSEGKWVEDKRGPLYNAKNCKVKKSQNCIFNGRPNTEYLYWRWKPNQCNIIPRFEPHTFLQLVKNKNLAFVGDSLARNQFDSLICMLLATSSSSSTPNYHITLLPNIDKFNFPSYNANLSFYWSPFLVEGVQKQSHKGPNYYNTMYLDHANEVWASDMEKFDMVVISLGHWFLMSSLYYEGGSVFGCRNCPSLNCTDISFYGPLRKALRTSLNSIIERKLKVASKGHHRKIDVIVRTYSPSHFKGEWDKGGTCSNTRPYRKGRKRLEGMDDEIRRIEIEEVENAKAKSKEFGGFKFEIMDVTKLALLRPDGHPGAYMNYFPFVKENSNYVQNDCLHWCLPGPIDTWNEILLEMMKKWKDQPIN